jgi:hypothetical protein
VSQVLSTRMIVQVLGSYTTDSGYLADAYQQISVLVKQVSLDKTREVQRIQNERGPVDIAVENRQVKIVSASCKHKTCMKMGAIDQAGQHLVCIPAQITVAIAGRSNMGVDGVTF